MNCASAIFQSMYGFAQRVRTSLSQRLRPDGAAGAAGADAGAAF